MPHTTATRTERRAFSRDGARAYAQPNPGAGAGPNRAERRHRHQRGTIAQLIHSHHDTAWLYSGTENASGQARINAKRNARAAFWADFAEQHRTVLLRVSVEVEDALLRHLDLLNAELVSRTAGATPWDIDLQLRMPDSPPDAAEAWPCFRRDYDDGEYHVTLDHIQWLRADGSTINQQPGDDQ